MHTALHTGGEADESGQDDRSLVAPASLLPCSNTTRIRLTEAATDALAWRIMEGDVGAGETLYGEHVEDVYYYFFRRTRDVQDTQDLTSETFTRAIAGLLKGKWSGVKFVAWLFTIAKHVYQEWCRYRGKRAMEVPSEDAGSRQQEHEQQEEDFLAELLIQERGRILWEVVGRLSEADQHIIHHRFQEDLSYAQIAQRTGQQERTCKVQLHRALGRLREELKLVGVWNDLGYGKTNESI